MCSFKMLTAATVDHTSDLVCEVDDVDGATKFNVEVENAGAVALSDFTVKIRDHQDGEWYGYVGGTDFATSSEALPFCTTVRPDTLAGSGKAHFHLVTGPIAGIRFYANVAASPNTTTVLVRGTGCE